MRAVYAPPFEAEREADRSTVAALERQAAAASGASPNSADSFFSGADSMKFLPFFALLMLGACATPSDEVRSARWENNAAMMDGAVPR